MTESPRRPLMNEFSKTGYRSYTSPNDRLSKRLGASLPNLEQPANDTVAVCINSSRAASLRKMTPDVGQCCRRKRVEMNSKSDFERFPLSPSRAEVSPESGEGFPPPRLPPSVSLLLCPELLL